MVGSGFGTYLAAIVLSVDVYDRTGSGKWLAALLIADFLPIVVIGLTLGPLVDRLSRRRLMIVSDLARVGVFCVLPFVSSPTAIVALAGVSGVATGFFRPAVYAGLPNLVTDDELTEANSLLAGVENLAWMVGPIVGGGLLATSGTDAAYLINAATFLVSAAIVVRIPAGRLQSEQSLSRGHWRDVRDGLELVRGSRQLLTVLVVWNVVLLGNACVNVAEVVFAKGSLGTGNVGLGVLVGSTGLGLTIGSFLAPTALGTLGLRKVYVGSIALMAMGWGVASAAPELWVAVPLVVVATIGNGGRDAGGRWRRFRRRSLAEPRGDCERDERADEVGRAADRPRLAGAEDVDERAGDGHADTERHVEGAQDHRQRPPA